MLVLLILTIVNIARESWKQGEDDDLSVSLIQLVGIRKEPYIPLLALSFHKAESIFVLFMMI